MDFGFSEEQEQLRDVVRQFLAERAPVSYARAMMEDPRGFSDAVWDSMAELGWMGLAIPERYGGSGLGILDLLLVVEEMGAVVLPGPYLSTVALGVPALVAVGADDQLARLLPPVARGEHRVTVAVAERPGLWAGGGILSRAGRDGDGFVIHGEKLFVPDAACADTIVIVTRLDDGLGFFAVPADAEGLSIEPMSTVDLTRRLAVVSASGVRLEASALLGGSAQAARSLDAIVDVAKTALAAEMCGCADRALEMTVEYAKIREQFGRAIGSFQALQHRCADMKVEVENAKSLVYFAGWALDSGDAGARPAAAMAKAYAGDACGYVTADAIQIHGGIGFTWEHDLHLYFKRVKAAQVTYGDAAANRGIVAGHLDL